MLSAVLHKPLQLLHVDFHVQFAVQECGCDIHLMYLRTHGHRDCKNDSNGVEFHYGCKGFAKIHTFYLQTLLGHQPYLKLNYNAVRILFGAKYSLALHGLMAFRQ